MTIILTILLIVFVLFLIDTALKYAGYAILFIIAFYCLYKLINWIIQTAKQNRSNRVVRDKNLATIYPEKKEENMTSNSHYNNLDFNGLDDYLEQAGLLIIDKDKASIAMIQRVFKIGFNRACRIMDQLCDLGVVGEEIGIRPRQILMDADSFENLISDIRQYREFPYEPTCISEEPEPNLPAEYLIKNVTGIEPDFSYDGKAASAMGNTFIYKCDTSSQLDIINNLVTYNSAKTLRLIIYDANITYATYNPLPQMLIPVISDRDKLSGGIHWLIAESRDRLFKFADIGVKNISAFNMEQDIKAPSKHLPFILFVISEFYPLRSDQQLNEDLIQLLLNSERTGIYCLFFSALDVKRLSLGVKEDFFNICTAAQIKNLLLMSIHQSPLIHTTFDIKSVDDMDGMHFENFCANLLEKNDFYNVNVTQGSGDHGIDILAEKDDISYAIQCKCYSSNIGNAAIQQAHTGKSIYKKDIAVVLTNQYFTDQAQKEADVLGVKLWDRDKLNSLIKSAT